MREPRSSRTLTVFWLVLGLVMALAPATAPADNLSDDLKFELHGYYRARSVSINNLANETRPVAYYRDQQANKDVIWPYARLEWTNYLVQKVRLEPVVSFRDLVKLQVTIDGLDNVVWGDNDALATSPLFAANPGGTTFRGESPPPVVLRRAWLDLNLKVGRLRVGRMASHWGMGLLSHGGGTHGGPDGYRPRDFSDFYFGSVYDRVLFATRPVSIVKHLLGHDDTHSNFVLAYAYDKLVEDYLPSDRGRAYYRPLGESGFLSDDDDDVEEHVLVLLYRNTELELWEETDQLNVGLYVVLRTQGKSTQPKDSTGKVTGGDYTGTGSLVHIWDFWIKARLGPVELETEWLFIRGHTDGGIPIPPELEKDAEIDAGAVRLSYLGKALDGVLEVGYSSGDADMSDSTFSQRPCHPNFGVGLLLFREILRERTARTLGRKMSTGLQSNGGVFNATYLFPRVRYRPLPWLEGILGVLVAWRNEPTRQASLYDKKSGDFLGAEVDAAIRATWAEAHLHFALETGYLVFGDALKDDYLDKDAAGAFTLQTRVSFEF